jgi:hypothetical protein
LEICIFIKKLKEFTGGKDLTAARPQNRRFHITLDRCRRLQAELNRLDNQEILNRLKEEEKQQAQERLNLQHWDEQVEEQLEQDPLSLYTPFLVIEVDADMYPV